MNKRDWLLIHAHHPSRSRCFSAFLMFDFQIFFGIRGKNFSDFSVELRIVRHLRRSKTEVCFYSLLLSFFICSWSSSNCLLVSGVQFIPLSCSYVLCSNSNKSLSLGCGRRSTRLTGVSSFSLRFITAVHSSISSSIIF